MMDDYSDWGIKMVWDNGKLEAFANVGSPFLYVNATNGGVEVDTKNKSRVWYNQDNVLGVEVELMVLDDQNQLVSMGKDSYVLFAPTGATWTVTDGDNDTHKFTSTLAGKDYASMVYIPDAEADSDKIETLEFYKPYAFNFIVDTTSSYEFDEEDAELVTTFNVEIEAKEGGAGDIIFGLYPHQWDNFKGSVVPGLEYDSPRGTMKIVTGKSFQTHHHHYGILPHLPLTAEGAEGYDEAKLKQLVLDLIETGEGANIFQGNEVYSTGVSVGRTAQVITIADQLGMTEERDIIVGWVKSAIEDWLTYEADGDCCWFYYDPSYGALIGNPPNQGMYTDSHINDMHFQTGYFIKAAALVAMVDPAWGKEWNERVEILIRSANTWDRNDPLFPYMRFFSPYKGHSWATGAGDFIDGPNQESSSEALNWASAVALWGMVMGNDTVRDLGIYIYTTESDATMHYWWDFKDMNYPHGPSFPGREHAIWEDAEYEYPMSGWVWGDKVGFATWFGSEQTGYQEYPVGINLLPMTAASTYLARDTQYVADFMDWFFAKYGNVNRWSELFWVWWALAEPEEAMKKYLAEPHGASEPSPPSETEPHYYHWMYNLLALGPYNSSVSANTSSYAVFGEGGNKTYVVYNPTNQALNVAFTDGAVITVPPYELVAEDDPTKVVANAGDDIIALDSDKDGQETVALDGSKSQSGNGAITTYDWALNGETIATTERANVTLPLGQHLISLVVTDVTGKVSPPDVVKVFVTTGEPVAQIKPVKSVADTDSDGVELVSLDGTESFDPDGTLASYSWQVGGEVVSTDPTIEVSLPTGVTEVTLVVTDNEGKQGGATVAVSVIPNVALAATAAASSTGEGSPANVLDQNALTVWVSAESEDAQWLEVDLGSVCPVEQVDLAWMDRKHAKAFKISAGEKAGGVDAQALVNVTDGQGGDASYQGEAVQARYVYVTLTEAYSAVGELFDSSGNFKVQISSETTNPSITFVPLANEAGAGFVYIQVTVDGNYQGSYPARPNEPYQVNASEGQTVSFDFKYTITGGAEQNSDTFEFEVGTISGGSTFGIKDIAVYCLAD